MNVRKKNKKKSNQTLMCTHPNADELKSLSAAEADEDEDF